MHIVRRIAATGAVLTLVSVAGAPVASAADDTTPVVLSDLSPATISALLGLLLPLVVALLTKYDVAPGVRIWVNMFLSAAAGAVGTLIASDGGFAWVTFILSSVAAFLTSALAYMGVYKPTGAAAGVASKTASFGFGSSQSLAGVPDEHPDAA